MFTLGLREGLEAALVVALLATLARGTEQARSIAVRVAAGVVVSVALVILVRRLHPHLSDTTLHAIKAAVAAGAVIVLISTVLWATSMRMSTSLAERFARSGAVGSLAFLTVAREGLELAVLPGTGEGALWGPDHAAMVAGVAVSAVIGIAAFALFRLAPARLLVVTAAAFTLIAAGMAAAALRSLQLAFGWVLTPAFDVTVLDHLGSSGQFLLKGVFGLHASPSLLEAVGYVASLVVVAVLVVRTVHRTTPHGGPFEPSPPTAFAGSVLGSDGAP